MKIKYLEWDSEFFGLSIGSIKIENECDFCPEDAKKFDLVYVFSQNESLNFKLVDQKITYKILDLQTKDISDFSETQFYSHNDTAYRDLLNLALQSGEYSRFKIDPYFKNSEFVRLYTEWLNKSINKTLASHIIIKKDNEKIVGFATLTKKSQSLADIGLVAVDKDYRGRGIAKEIILKSIILAKSLGYEEIQVVTQLDNIPANILYKKCGFEKHSIINIYHHWNNDTI